MNVDDLAQEIRRVDGNHDLGSGALAEALMPYLRARSSAPEAREGEPVGVVYSLKADLNTAELPDGTLLYTHPAHPSADHAELTRLAEAAGEEALGNLLAVIHGDGGHRALEVGTKQAALEAEKIVAGLFAAPSADKLRIDLWWNAEDWETTFDNIEDAYEAATGGYCVGVARLGRATEHDAVWAAMIDIDTTGDGEADDREIRLFATEDEARQALANQGADQ